MALEKPIAGEVEWAPKLNAALDYLDAKVAPDLVIDIEANGAVGDDLTDNTTAIQAALDEARLAGGGTVFVPVGIFRTGPLTIGQRVRLVGAGYGSVLKHRDGAGHLLTTFDTSVDLFQIENLFLDCWRQVSGAGIYINNNATGYSSGYNDTHHNITNVMIVGSAEAGVHMPNGVREVRLDNVTVRDPRGSHAFFVDGTDNFFSMCTAATSRTPYHGWYINGSNNRFLGCKAFYCGFTGEASDGFHIIKGRNEFAACESQDNGRWGFYFNGSSEVSTAVGLLADSNAAGGIHVDNTSGQVRGLNLSGFATFSRSGGRYPQPIGIKFTGNPTRGSFIGIARDNTSLDVDGAPTNATVLVTGTTGERKQRIVGSSLEHEGGPIISRAGSYNTPENLSGAELVHQDDSDNVTPSTVDLRMGFRSASGSVAKWAGLRASRDDTFASKVGLTIVTTRGNNPLERAKFTADGGFELKNHSGGAPLVNPVSGGVLYAEAGALKWRSSAGTVTTIAPA